jgi:two-component system, chemotaxis family, chemotaxis protein CheY
VPDLVSALASLKVCIVDADSQMRQMIRDALTGMGISQIRECADSGMAQQLIGEFKPDLCIFDWSTGPLDPITFIKTLRARESGQGTPMQLIMMMANANTRRVIEARNAGVDEFLVKPISLRALHGRLLTLVENPRVFVRTPTYVGPDRRRQDRPFAGADRRVTGQGTQSGQGEQADVETVATEVTN